MFNTGTLSIPAPGSDRNLQEIPSVQCRNGLHPSTAPRNNLKEVDGRRISILRFNEFSVEVFQLDPKGVSHASTHQVCARVVG